jgi:heme oxygenase
VTFESADIMDRLKEATSEQHRDAERRQLQKAMASGQVPVDVYAAWLGQMFLLHRTLRDTIADHIREQPLLGEIVRDEGRHVANLEADLALLGRQAGEARPLPSTDRAIRAIGRAAVSDPLSLLGYNYVLEGSMNGNRFIARALLPSLPVPAVAYLDPYGEEQRPTWQAYRERMNGVGIGEDAARRIVSAAQDMFTFIAEMSDELMEPAHSA